ncbi:MAG: hypothetical protein SU899_01365 [Chloroflexota bacterium]|nr:hypothetical protein [Chloroflexota bacterium]
MTKYEAIELLKQALNEIPNLKKLDHSNQEFKLWRDKVLDIIRAGLDAHDKNRFSRPVPKRIDWSWVSGNNSAQDRAQYLEDLDKYETALKSIIQKYELLGSDTSKEVVYPSGTPYNAYKDIKEIIISAAKKLVIVDPYVDGSIITLLENAKPNVEIQILTRNMKGDFRLAAQNFGQQRKMAGQGILEVRKDKEALHDRFIIADDNVFHLGTSIKDAGTKMCAMSKFEGSDIKSKLSETLSGYWAEAEIVL